MTTNGKKALVVADSNEDNKNYFLYRKQFPEINSILERKGKSIKEIFKNALFVLDTNSLLAPFNVGTDNIEKIGEVYKKLISKKKLFIPEHALLEFAKNRSTKIAELFTAIDNQLSSFSPIKLSDYPILSDFDIYKKLKKFESTIKENIKDYKGNLEELKESLLDWNWSDPVTTMYQTTFNKDIIISATGKDEELIKEFQLRMHNEIPPGNKDKNKSENGMGDFLIWKSILELGKAKKKDIVFVSNDEKNDWVLKGNKKSISTKFELVDEFYRFTGGFDFMHTTFNNFLNHEGLEIEIKDAPDRGKTKTNVFFSHAKEDSLTIDALFGITKLIYDYLSEAEEDLENTYIGGELAKYIEIFKENYRDNYFGTPLWGKYASYLSFFENCLNEIQSLNGTIHYNSVRQKRSNQTESIMMNALCKEFVSKFEEFNFSVYEF